MTDLTLPAEIGDIPENAAAVDNLAAAHSWEEAGTGAWIADGSDIGGAFPSLDETGLEAFDYDSASGLTVTILGGEAFGIGGWLARDRSTDVDVPDDATTTIYVGVDIGDVLSSGTSPSDNDNIIIGPESAFEDPDPRAPIWEVTTSGGSVTDTTDLRILRKPFRWDSDTQSAAIAGDTTVDGRMTVENGRGDGRVPIELQNTDASGTAYVHGLIDESESGVSRGVGFSSSVDGPLDAYIDVTSGAMYIDGGDRAASRLWTGENFNHYTDGEAREAVTDGTLPGSVDIASDIELGGRRIEHRRPAGGRADYRVLSDGNPRYLRRLSDDSGTLSHIRYDTDGNFLNTFLSVDLDTGLVTIDERTNITDTLGLEEEGLRFEGTGTKYPINFNRDDSGNFVVAGLVDDPDAEYSRSFGWFSGTTQDVPNAEVAQSGDAYFRHLDVRGSLTNDGDATLRKTEAWDEGDTDRVVYEDTDGGTLELVRE